MLTKENPILETLGQCFVNPTRAPPLWLSRSHLSSNRCLIRSNAFMAKSPDQHVQPHLSIDASSPLSSPNHMYPANGGAGGSKNSLLLSASNSSHSLCGPQLRSGRRHSDSNYTQRRGRRPHQRRGLLQPKYSYSPNPSFDVDHTISPGKNPLEGYSPGLVLQNTGLHNRRESFLYRSDSDYEATSPRSISRASSIASEAGNAGHVEDLIVTPFAQILASLGTIRANYIFLTKVPAKNRNENKTPSREFGPSLGPLQGGAGSSNINHSAGTGAPSSTSSANKSLSDDVYMRTAVETLEELDWCLDQLESIQTHRSVSDLATSKFKRMLNKELSHFSETSRSGNQVSEYICSTFLDKTQDVDLSSYHHPQSKTFSNNVPSGSGTNSGTLEDQSNVVVEEEDEDETPEQRVPNNLDPNEQDVSDHEMSKTENGQSPNSLAKTTSPSNTTAIELSWKMGGDKIITAEQSRIRKASMESFSIDPEALDKIFDDDLEQLIPLHPLEMTCLFLFQHLEMINQWGLNVFKTGEMVKNQRALSCVTFRIFEERDLMTYFKIPADTLKSFLITLEDHYLKDIPYHNHFHAADVTQSTHVLLNSPNLKCVFSSLETFAAIFASAIHDVDHPGVTNQYLINTSSELALLYKDESVLENHHLAVAFKLLQQPGCDILINLTVKQRQSFRKMVIDMVLATDMSKHMSLLADLKTMVESKKVAGSGVIRFDNYNERIQVLQNMVHCSDLSNPTKPLDIYRQWVDRIMEEFFRQGDQEREAGLEISPMCDRYNATIEKSQARVGFIEYIVHPLWETWADLVHPDSSHILEMLDCNRQWYSSKIPHSPTDPYQDEMREESNEEDDDEGDDEEDEDGEGGDDSTSGANRTSPTSSENSSSSEGADHVDESGNIRFHITKDSPVHETHGANGL
ncbi:hypothetical protein TCAL_00657 [Tigriopus californicus]|uniref:Phosphodiesterase n=1 Tax=Tigriopus californicus TaxID=6832 RepID=A0A553P9R9_TIGCA|nr:hypothetical protein TCAL_00657 [Tigriopus californicus]